MKPKDSSVKAFEAAFAQKVGRSHAFAFWKGRVALYAILKAMGVGQGDEVILPGYTCVMNVNPIKYLGAKPIYADIDPVTYNLTAGQIAGKITPRTRAIIAQHTYGFPCRMDEILDLGGKHNLPVIEDCCLALGSTYKGKLCGTFGKAAYWSYQWNKPFTMGLGGLGATDDEELARRIEAVCEAGLVEPSPKSATVLAIQRMIYRTAIYPRTTAIAALTFRWLTKKGLVIGSSSKAEFEPVMAADFFMGMSAGQARAGLRQIGRWERNLAHRRDMRRMYDELLAQHGWQVPPLPEGMDPVLVRYPIRVADKAKALAEAPANFVEIGSWFECPLHPIETPMHLYDYTPGMCPVAEQACREVVNLPTHLRAGRRTAERSAEFVAKIGPADPRS